MDFYPTDKSIAVLTFKYRSSPVRKAEAVYSKLKHMQAIQNIAVERSPIELTFLIDASIYVYEEFLLNPGSHSFELKVVETARPEVVRSFRLTTEVQPGTSLAITYSESKGFFTLGGR